MNTITKELSELGEKELNTDEGWYMEYDDGTGTTIWSKTLFPECDIKTYKVIFEVSRSVEIVYTAFKDQEARVKFSPKFSVSKFVAQDGEKDIVFQINKPIIPFLSERELLLERLFKKKDDSFMMICKSTTHDDYPINNTYPRTDTIFQACKAVKLEEKKTQITFIHQQQLGFWIPQFVIYQAMKMLSPKIPTIFDVACDYHEKQQNEK
eukprot:gene3415-5960_t